MSALIARPNFAVDWNVALRRHDLIHPREKIAGQAARELSASTKLFLPAISRSIFFVASSVFMSAGKHFQDAERSTTGSGRQARYWQYPSQDALSILLVQLPRTKSAIWQINNPSTRL